MSAGGGPGPVWVDSHCHLQWGDDVTLADVDAAVARARDAGVAWMVCVGTDLETSHAAVELADRHPDVWATVGLHPHDASKLAAEWGMLEPLAQHPKVVAIGEAGFDLHYRHSPTDEQEAAFRTQIRLAKRLERALVIHSRDAWDDTFRVLDDEGLPERTVFHCFTGGPAEAAAAVERGAALSFSGVVTFGSADDVRAAAAVVPADRLLVETDSPFLTPVPFRGKRPNEPALVPLVGAAVARARGDDEAAVAAATTANAAHLFAVHP